MVIKGNSRRAAGFWSKHLMNGEDNERVAVVEMKGVYADDVKEALREMRLLSAGTRAENPYYIVSMNPRQDESLTPEQWEIAVDKLEANLGLTDHARFQVEHEKEGRVHRHVVWSRVDVDSMTVVPTDNNYLIHANTSRELEQLFDHERTPVPPAPERDRFKDWETFRAAESGIDPKEMKAEITALWQQSDSGRAFQAAIEEKGYLLAKGDRRDFVLIDPEGDVHSLARRIDGAKAADIRAKMTDLDHDSLMGAKEASAWMQAKEGEAENSGSSDARILPEEQAQQVTSATVEPSHNPKLAVLEKYAPDHPPLAPPEPGGYLTPATAQDFAAMHKTLLPHIGNQAAQEQQHAWQKLEARRAELPPAEPIKDAPNDLWGEQVTRQREQEKEPELER